MEMSTTQNSLKENSPESRPAPPTYIMHTCVCVCVSLFVFITVIVHFARIVSEAELTGHQQDRRWCEWDKKYSPYSRIILIGMIMRQPLLMADQACT